MARHKPYVLVEMGPITNPPADPGYFPDIYLQCIEDGLSHEVAIWFASQPIVETVERVVHPEPDEVM
jgi:hypothetical protein